VGVTRRGAEVLVMESGFEAPKTNLGPRVSSVDAEGHSKVLATVPANEPAAAAAVIRERHVFSMVQQ